MMWLTRRSKRRVAISRVPQMRARFCTGHAAGVLIVDTYVVANAAASETDITPPASCPTAFYTARHSATTTDAPAQSRSGLLTA